MREHKFIDKYRNYRRSCAGMLTTRRWALLDVEFIRTSSGHCCGRKLYILSKNCYTNMEKEFYPCRRYTQLDSKYQRSFQYCKQNIHKLTPMCSQAITKLNEFIVYNDTLDTLLENCLLFTFSSTRKLTA